MGEASDVKQTSTAARQTVPSAWRLLHWWLGLAVVVLVLGTGQYMQHREPALAYLAIEAVFAGVLLHVVAAFGERRRSR